MSPRTASTGVRLLGLWALAAGCAGVPKEPALDSAELGGGVEDVLLGPVDPSTIAQGAGVLLLGEARHTDVLVARRSEWAPVRSDLSLLVDVHGDDGRAAAECVDRLVLVALDPGGPVLVDREGRWTARLAGGAPLPLAVRLDAEARIAARAALDDDDALRALLEGEGGR